MLVLASASSARRNLLNRITSDFTVTTAGHVEDLNCPSPEAVVRQCVTRKIEAVLSQQTARASQTILSADTVLFHRSNILGKPGQRRRAAAYLNQLSGQRFDIYTATAVCRAGSWQHALDICRVRLKQLSATEIHSWLDDRRAQHCAGGLALQDRCAGWVCELQGSFSAALGLPLVTVRRLLCEVGYPKLKP